jgi:DNA-binding transcriptional regulator YiaG
MGQDQRITVPMLMRVAYGESKLSQASSHSEKRKRLFRIFENDLEVLNYHGIKPVFDPATYPPDIQPLWAKLADLPDDAEAALEFWMNDGSSDSRLTDTAPRGKWNRLMNARLLRFDLPTDWQNPTSSKHSDKSQRQPRNQQSKQRQASRQSLQSYSSLSGQQISDARKKLQLSQRALAQQIGKSQSWVRDIEQGRFQPASKEQALLCRFLGIEH